MFFPYSLAHSHFNVVYYIKKGKKLRKRREGEGFAPENVINECFTRIQKKEKGITQIN
jgi:hypothetical protein